MGNDIIQAHYEHLETIARRFGQQAHVQTTLDQNVQRGVQSLQAGGWQGRGASAFFGEMNREVLPAMRRLADALQQAQTVTLKIKEIIQAAEEEAARPFRSKEHLVPAVMSTAGNGTQAQLSGPPFGDYNNLPFIPPLVLGPRATYQDLAAMIEQMYRINDFLPGGVKSGVDQPVKIVRIGDNDYLIAIIGTDAGSDAHTGPNDWFSNLSTGRGVPSRFQIEAQQLIEQNVPPGANIHLAGHSQGGHVVMNLAGTQDLADRYHIASVNTFGSSGSVPINPQVGATNYHNFLLSDDPIRLAEFGSERIPFTNIQIPIGSPFSLLGVPGSGASPSIDPQVIAELGGHGGYYQSPYLANQALPFSLNRWEVVGSYEANGYDNYRTAWNNINTGWSQGNAGQVVWGGIDFASHLTSTSAVAYAQNTANTVTQYLPTSWQVAVDRQFDDIGQWVATAPAPSTWIPAAVDSVWSGFWD